MANKKFNDEDGVWRTIGGRRVFIKNGQSLEEAMKESGKFKSAKKEETKKEDSVEKTKPDFELTGDDFTDFVNEMKHNNQLDKSNGREETVDAQYVIERLQGINTPESRRALRELELTGDRLKDEDVIKALEIGSKDPYGDFSKEEAERVKAVEVNGKTDPYDDPESEESQRLQSIQSRYDEYLQATEGRGASYGELAHIEGLRGKELDDFEKELDDFESNGGAEETGLDEYDREKLEGLIGNGIPQDAYDEFVDITGEEPQAINNAIGQLADDLTGYEELNDFEDEYGAISDYDRLDNLYEDLNTYLDDKIDEGEIDESFKDDVLNTFGDAEDTANSQMDEEIQAYLDKASGKSNEKSGEDLLKEHGELLRKSNHASTNEEAQEYFNQAQEKLDKYSEVKAEDETKNWTKEDYIKRNKDLEELKARVQKQYDDDMADARATGNDKLEESSKKAREEQLRAIDELQKRNQEAFKQYTAKQNAPEGEKMRQFAEENNVKTFADEIKEQESAPKTGAEAMNQAIREKANKTSKTQKVTSEPSNGFDMRKYEVELKHDNGTIKLSTVASDEATARKMIMNSEGAPESAIVGVKDKGSILKENNKAMNDSIREKAGKKKKETESALPQYKPITEQGNSNRKQVRENIQAHIMEHYTPDYTGDDSVSPQEAFVRQMEAMGESNMWRAGKKIAEGGSYLISNVDMEDFLNDLKINPKGKKFNSDKAFDMYTSLIGRESARLYEKYKKNLKK